MKTMELENFNVTALSTEISISIVGGTCPWYCICRPAILAIEMYDKFTAGLASGYDRFNIH